MKEINKDLIRQSIDKWGFYSQVVKMIEECTELSLAFLHHFSSKKISIDNVFEEMVDVSLMIEEFKILLNLDESTWDELWDKKQKKWHDNLLNDN